MQNLLSHTRLITQAMIGAKRDQSFAILLVLLVVIQAVGGETGWRGQAAAVSAAAAIPVGPAGGPCHSTGAESLCFGAMH